MKSVVCVLFVINVVFCGPEKWHESEDGSKFYIETDKKYNWFEAWNDCARKNMSLITIDSDYKHQQIDNLLRELYNSCPPVWIGGHDNAVPSHFEWVSTGEAFTFTNWGPDQPSNLTKNEHCILMWIDFKWHDYYCSNKIGYICEENPAIKNGCGGKGKNTRAHNEIKNFLFYFNNHNN